VLGDGVRLGTHFSANNGQALIETESGYQSVNDIGAIIGEDSELKNHVTASSGLIMGARCRVSSATKIEGLIPNKSIVM
jgi:UDP-3-O-[3-hydroxymyristoyl] glucosamine N-acyltransferase